MADHIHDLIVVGGGIIGAAIAWRLAQLRFRVAILEAGVFGAEASSAAAGMLAPGGEVFDRSPFHSLLLKSHGMYKGFVAELTEESGHWIHFRRCGAFELTSNEREWDLARRRAAFQATMGIHSEKGIENSLFTQMMRWYVLFPLCTPCGWPASAGASAFSKTSRSTEF